MIFKRRDIDQYTNSLSQYVPNDRLFASKSIKNSNFRNFLRGLSWELFRVNGLIKEYSDEILPDRTIKFIEEWEAALGIPDDCFKTNISNDRRSLNILVKLASLGVQTNSDFVSLAALFDTVVFIRTDAPNLHVFPFIFPITFSVGDLEARHTIIIQFVSGPGIPLFPLTFPIPFSDEISILLECLYRKLAPANCAVIFEYP